MNLGDGRGRDRGALEGGEQLVRVCAELGADHLADGGPWDRGHIVLQPAQLGDELFGQQVAAGGQHLTELDEGDAALFECQAKRAGQAGAAIWAAELRSPSASQVGKKAAAHEYPADLRVTPRPAQAFAQSAGEIDRSRQRPGGDKHLRDHQERHAGQERDRVPEDDKPQGRQQTRLLRDDGGDDRGSDQNSDHSGGQRPQQGQAQAEQPTHPESVNRHRQRDPDHQEGDGQGGHGKRRGIGGTAVSIEGSPFV